MSRNGQTSFRTSSARPYIAMGETSAHAHCLAQPQHGRARWKMRFLASVSESISTPSSSNQAAHSVTTIGVADARVDFGRVMR